MKNFKWRIPYILCDSVSLCLCGDLLILLVQPLLVCLEIDRTAHKVLNKYSCRGGAAARQDLCAITQSRVTGRQHVGLIELAEQILCDYKRPHIRVVDSRISV